MNQPKKRTLYEILKEKLGKKPATREEIEQLKLEAEKESLKAEIAKCKKIQKESKSRWNKKLFTDGESKNADIKKQLWGDKD